MNDLTTREDQLANLKAVTSSLRSGSSQLILRFVKGDWLGGQDSEEFKLGTKLAANIQEIGHGWNRWEGGKVVDRRLVLMAGGQLPPSRSEMGHTDQAAWDRDDRGHPIDPVRATYELPVREITGLQREMIIAGGSRGFEGAIRDLLNAYLTVAGHVPPFVVPVVSLDCGKYVHRQYGIVKVPVLSLAGWFDATTGKISSKPAGDGGNGKIATKARVKVELDDVPF